MESGVARKRVEVQVVNESAAEKWDKLYTYYTEVKDRHESGVKTRTNDGEILSDVGRKLTRLSTLAFGTTIILGGVGNA